jgi:phosphate transport system substrate-binding protein
MIAPFYAISEDLQGIGYSVFYYEENMAPKEKIKLLAVDGIKPDYESIQTHQYPFTTEVYMVVRADSPPTSIARRLRDWLLSPTGQEMVEQSGYVPIQD